MQNKPHNNVGSIEANYQNLTRVIAWIQNADNKASIIIAFNGGLLALLNQNSTLITILKIKLTFMSILTFLLLGLFLIAFALSLCNALRVLLPQTKKKLENSLFFFGAIAEMPKKMFLEKIQNINEDQILANLSEQTFINSKIATTKFNHLSRAWKWLIIAIIVGLLTILARTLS